MIDYSNYYFNLNDYFIIERLTMMIIYMNFVYIDNLVNYGNIIDNFVIFVFIDDYLVYYNYQMIEINYQFDDYWIKVIVIV